MKTLLKNILYICKLNNHKSNLKQMPKLFRFLGYLFHFYSNDHEPPHVHMDGKGTQNKYDLDKKEWTKKETNSQDLKKAKEEIEKKRKEIEAKWNEHFKKNNSNNSENDK